MSTAIGPDAAFKLSNKMKGGEGTVFLPALLHPGLHKDQGEARKLAYLLHHFLGRDGRIPDSRTIVY